MSPSDVIRVVVVDDHPIVRDGLRALLESVDGFEVVAEASDGHAAVAAAHRHLPDVVIMDLQIPRLSGVEATRRITSEVAGVGVLVITMYEDNESLFAALGAGALGYLVKGADQQEILRAITAVANRESLLGPALAERVLRRASRGDPTGRAFPDLTSRELDVLDQMAAGDGNGAIARSLGLQTKTVANHVSSIFNKLHVTDRAQAIVRAREAGLGREHERDW